MTLSELRERPHLSASQINQLLNICSLQFYFERIAKLKRQFVSSSLVFGSCVHAVLEQQTLIRMKGGEPNREDALEMFTERWDKSQKDQPIKYGAKESGPDLADKGRRVVECFMDNTDPDEKVLAVSEAFAVPVYKPDGTIAELPIVGEFDLVVERDGKPVIVDWKTAARKWPARHEDKSLQATVYSYAWNQLHGERPPIRFDVVTKTKAPVFEHRPTARSESAENRMAMLIDKAQQIVKHGLYYPHEASFFCASCPYADACRKWQA